MSKPANAQNAQGERKPGLENDDFNEASDLCDFGFVLIERARDHISRTPKDPG